MNIFMTLKKGLLGFATGLAATILFGVAQALLDYKPVVCTKEIIENCSPQYISTLYYSIIPVVTSSIVMAANWLKNRSKA